MKRWAVISRRNHITTSASWSQLRCRRQFAALAQKIRLGNEPAPPTLTRTTTSPRHVEISPEVVDPLALTSKDLHFIQSNLLELMGSAHPDLRDMAEMYFLTPSKQLRPIVVILISKAMNGLGQNWGRKRRAMHLENTEELDRPLAQPGVLRSWSPAMPNDRESFSGLFALRSPTQLGSSADPHDNLPAASLSSLLPTQTRLAQIVEMINIAFILHDGISPGSGIAGQCEKNTKLSILGGDFLLGRASSALSRLGEAEVVELIASVISNISEGEILQLPGIIMPQIGVVPPPQTLNEAWNLYTKRTYLRTASLIAKGARAAVILGGSSQNEPWSDAAYYYGRHLGFASQLVEDASEIESILSPTKFKLATGPLLYAWQEYPSVGTLIDRKFSEPSDRDEAKEYLAKSSAVLHTKSLARKHSMRAKAMLRRLPACPETEALATLADMVVERTWT